MSLLKLRIVPDPVLRKVASAVTGIDKETALFMQSMRDAMYEHHGIGLAAPQVGELKRVLVMDVAEEQNAAKAIMMANPEVIWKSEDTFTYKEGCLSIPGQYAEVTRAKKVRVKYIDINGEAKEMEAEDLASSCVQHEIDHLNGVLFVDYLSRLKRDMMIRRVQKAQRALEEEAANGREL